MRTNSCGIDEVSSNTQAISFENEEGTGGGNSLSGQNAMENRKQSTIEMGTVMIRSPPNNEDTNEEETRFGNSQQ